MIETVKTTFSMTYGSLADQVGLSYRTLMTAGSSVLLPVRTPLESEALKRFSP